MSVAASQNNWSEANQRYLVAEFARLKLRLGAEGDAEAVMANSHAARAALPGSAAIDTLAELFGLSAFERDLLLFVAGVEMDAELARLCAVAQGQSQRPHAAFGVALAALENSHWSALALLLCPLLVQLHMLWLGVDAIAEWAPRRGNTFRSCARPGVACAVLFGEMSTSPASSPLEPAWITFEPQSG